MFKKIILIITIVLTCNIVYAADTNSYSDCASFEKIRENLYKTEYDTLKDVILHNTYGDQNNVADKKSEYKNKLREYQQKRKKSKKYNAVCTNCNRVFQFTQTDIDYGIIELYCPYCGRIQNLEAGYNTYVYDQSQRNAVRWQQTMSNIASNLVIQEQRQQQDQQRRDDYLWNRVMPPTVKVRIVD